MIHMTIYKNPMKIIFIHGMNQQNYNADTLKQFWLDIFKLGISELQQRWSHMFEQLKAYL